VKGCETGPVIHQCRREAKLAPTSSETASPAPVSSVMLTSTDPSFRAPLLFGSPAAEPCCWQRVHACPWCATALGCEYVSSCFTPPPMMPRSIVQPRETNGARGQHTVLNTAVGRTGPENTDGVWLQRKNESLRDLGLWVVDSARFLHLPRTMIQTQSHLDRRPRCSPIVRHC
jgi:hypothetical protein